MTEQAPQRALLDAADRLSGALEGMRGELKAVNERQDRTERRQKRDGHVIAGLVVSLILDVLLTVVVAVFAVTARDASDTSHRNGVTIGQLHQSQVIACTAGNHTRANEVALWEHIYSLAHITARTPARKRQADNELIAYIKGVFAPRDCKAAYRIPG